MKETPFERNICFTCSKHLKRIQVIFGFYAGMLKENLPGDVDSGIQSHAK